MSRAPDADVIVVGAGVAGAATAFHLSRLGAGDVLVVDRDTAGSGMSSRSSAMIRMHYTFRPEVELAVRSDAMFDAWTELTGRPRFVRRTGFARLVLPGEEQALRANVAMQRDCGARAEVLAPRDFAALAPGLRTDDLTEVAWEPDGGYGDGALVAGDLLAAARERGVRYRPHTPVQALLRDGDRVTGIQTPDGPRHAGMVVAAAGVWSPALLATIGVDLPIETEFHQVAVLSHGPGRGTPIACIDSTTQTYFRPEAGGTRTLVGSFTGPRGIDPDTVAPPPGAGPAPRGARHGASGAPAQHGGPRLGRGPGGWAGGAGGGGRPAGARAGRRRPGHRGHRRVRHDPGRPPDARHVARAGRAGAGGRVLRDRLQDLPRGGRGRGRPGHRTPGRGQCGHHAAAPGPVRRGAAGVAPVPVLGRLRRREWQKRRTRCGEAPSSPDGGVPLERSLPGRSYTSEAEFARERDQVLLPGWFCVGRADGLTEPGCYLAADVCGESIIVARTGDGSLAGYYNLCRHRGSRLVPRPSAASRPPGR